jgi:hypothetical protein
MVPMALPADWITCPHTGTVAAAAPPDSAPPPPPPPRFCRTAEKASCRAVDAADAALPSASFTRSSTWLYAHTHTPTGRRESTQWLCTRGVLVLARRPSNITMITTVWISSTFLCC